VKPNSLSVVTEHKRRICDKSCSGFEKLADYRLYCLDGANKVASAEWVEADDDEAAIEVAKQMHEGQQCELWQGRRFVARLDLRREA